MKAPATFTDLPVSLQPRQLRLPATGAAFGRTHVHRRHVFLAGWIFWPSLSPVTVLILKSVVSGVGIATPILLRSVSTTCRFHPLTFKLFDSPHLRPASCGQHTVGCVPFALPISAFSLGCLISSQLMQLQLSQNHVCRFDIRLLPVSYLYSFIFPLLFSFRGVF